MQNSLTRAQIGTGGFAGQSTAGFRATVEPKRLRLVWSSDAKPTQGPEDADGALAAIDELLIL